MGGRAGGERLRSLPPVARPPARVEARVHRMLRARRRSLRHPAGRLRARNDDGRGPGRLRPAQERAHPADRGLGGRRRRARRRALPGGGPAADQPRRDDGLRLRAHLVPARQHRPSLLLGVRDDRRPRHDALLRDRPRVAVQLPARDRPRPLRARRQPVARAHAARRGLLVGPAREPEPAVGERGRPLAAVLPLAPPAARGHVPRRARAPERRGVPGGGQLRQAVLHPGRCRRGHLRHAHHPAVRARAGADRRDALDRRSARTRGTRGSRSTSGSPSRRTGSASSRTCTGRRASSATSRPTSSAT